MKSAPGFGTGAGTVYGLFILSIVFAFGIGYKVGQRSSAPSVAPHPSSVPASREASGTTLSRRDQPGARQSTGLTAVKDVRSATTPYQRLEIRAEQPRMMWTSVGKTAYTLYLSSFQKLADAEREKQRLESKGLTGIEIAEHQMTGSGGAPWYRLKFGRFDSREAAVAYGRQLTDRGMIRDFWPKELL